MTQGNQHNIIKKTSVRPVFYEIYNEVRRSIILVHDMISRLKKYRTKELTDIEAIEGIQDNDQSVANSFYLSCRRYYIRTRTGVLDFKSNGAQEVMDIFQDSFLILWQEIQTRQIYVRDNYAWRTDRNGNSRKMSASLKTYLLSIAKYRNYELIREEAVYAPEQPNSVEREDEQTEEYISEWIVEMCVNALPPRCKEILTLFYYENKSLDEILKIRHENQSKDGLKSGKSKCMKSLKDKISAEFERRKLKPYCHV